MFALDSAAQVWYSMEHKVTYRDSDGVRRTSIVDDENPFAIKIYTEQQMDAILESVKLEQENIVPASANKHLARVPITVYEQSLREQWDEADWKKWLNDPDNANLRVWRGRV